MLTHFGEEEVVESDDVLVVGQHVAEPRDHPRQREYRPHLALLQKVVHLGTALLDLHYSLDKHMPTRIYNQADIYQGVHVVQQVRRLVHGGRHELFQVADGQSLHYVVPKHLPHHQQEGNCNVVVALGGGNKIIIKE